MRKYNIKLNGKTFEVEIEEVSREENEKVAVKSEAAPKKTENVIENTKQGTPSGFETLAPMPGTILDIRVKVGQKVKKNEVVLILEAMKMENEIVAETEGTITSIQVNKGDMVSSGDLLLTIG